MAEPSVAEETYEGWAIVELMGRRQVAGRIQAVELAGARLLRIDVPGEGDETAVTQLYGGAAIYCVTPCDEATARTALRNRYSLPPAARLALPAPGDDGEDPF